jgi:hypothetical protein
MELQNFARSALECGDLTPLFRHQPAAKTFIDSSMKALYFTRFGPPAVLTVENIPRPKLREGEVLIEIKAAAVNPSDVKNVAGNFPVRTTASAGPRLHRHSR